MMVIKEKNNIKITMIEIDVAGNGHITNTYVIQDTKTNNAILIDPADDKTKILSDINSLGATIKYCILTHSHADHFGALEDIIKDKSMEDMKIYLHELDIEGLNDSSLNGETYVGLTLSDIPRENIIAVKEVENIKLDSINIEVIHTPGHTKGSILLYEKTTETIFSGDTIFKNTYGRTDLKGGSSKDMKLSLDKIFYRFDDIDVFAGHGEIFKLDESKRKIKLIYAFKG